MSESHVTLPHAAGQHELVAHQFDDLDQQHKADSLGMWVFLATEVLFFGVLFTAYAIYRMLYPAAWAEASHHLNQPLGALNTAVLLCSSLSVVLAVHAAQTGHRKRLVTFLLLTVVLGAIFLGIKAYEYYVDYLEGLIPGRLFTYESQDAAHVELFFLMYFTMTGIHAFHMIIGLGLFTVLAFFAWRRRYTPEKHMPIELCGLYWHFVDVVWVFLFPLLYLIG